MALQIFILILVLISFFSDPLHTCLGLGGLSLIGEPGLALLHPALNITQRAADHLQEIHKRWTAGS